MEKKASWIDHQGECDHVTFNKAWADVHMPQVLKSSSMKPKHYIVIFLDEPTSGKLDFNGCAQLWMMSYEEYRTQAKAAGVPTPGQRSFERDV